MDVGDAADAVGAEQPSGGLGRLVGQSQGHGAGSVGSLESRCARVRGATCKPKVACQLVDARTASRTASASLVAATSWARTIDAPWCAANTADASDPTIRSGAGLPLNFARNDLRDAPTRSGLPSWVSSRSRRRRSKLCAAVLANPRPG